MRLAQMGRRPFVNSRAATVPRRSSSSAAAVPQPKPKERESSVLQEGEQVPQLYRNTYKSAGVLPFVEHDGQLWLFLGLEEGKKRKGWCEFGGKRDSNYDLEHDIEATAVREFLEESDGVWGTREDIKEEVKARLQGRSAPAIWNGNGLSLLFLLRMPWQQAFPREGKRMEKKEFRWVPAADLSTAVAQLRQRWANKRRALATDAADAAAVEPDATLVTSGEARKAELPLERFFLQTISLDGAWEAVESLQSTTSPAAAAVASAATTTTTTTERNVQ